MHPAELPIPQLLEQCDVIRTRRSGPGGQHRNKVETAIVLTHRSSGTQVEASERRSQSENLEVAINRLRRKLAVAVRVMRPLASFPSELWRSRLHGTRLSISQHHTDFPTLLAESLDILAQIDWNVPALAPLLNTTPSQLIRFWKQEPESLQHVNNERQQRGHGRLQ